MFVAKAISGGHRGGESKTRRCAQESFKDSIDKWMEAADYHDTTSPDIMTALKLNQSEVLSVLKRVDERQTEMQKEVNERLTKMEAKIK